MNRYLLVYPQGDVDRVTLVSVSDIPVESLNPVPRLGPDGDVDSWAVVRMPDGELNTVLTLDLIDLNADEDDL
jgi:hypothetical protein